MNGEGFHGGQGRTAGEVEDSALAGLAAPTVDCPDGHGRMTAEAFEYRGRRTNWSVPDGPAWRLTCPVCGWEACVDCIGLPFWTRPLRTWKGGRASIDAVHVEDVHPDSRDEVQRRIRFMQALCGNRAARRGGSPHDAREAVAHEAERASAKVVHHLGLDAWEDE